MSQILPSEAFVAEGTTRMLMYFACGLPVLLCMYSLFSPASLRHIPTVGASSLPLLSYKGAWNFQVNGGSVLQRGYEKYKGKVFKVPFLDRWVAVITGRRLVDEIQRLSDDVLSAFEGGGEVFGFKYIFPTIAASHDRFYVNMLQRQLVKHMPVAFDEMYDEMDTVFKGFVPANENEWVPVPALELARAVVARASNRIFVGLPLCRDPAYLKFVVNFTVDVARARDMLAYFPPILKPLAAKVIVNLDSRIQEGLRIFDPLIMERMKVVEQLGKDSPEKPNDMFQWIIDAIAERKQPIEQVVLMAMYMNIAAINTTSNSFTDALFHLAARPDCIAVLRQEAESAVEAEGWTKNAMGELVKMDSFLRECQRYSSIVPMTCMRKALQPFTLSDGTHIPRGTVCVTPAFATHFDDDNYADAAAFDPWRHVSADAGSPVDGAAPKQIVTTSAEYVPFGHGRNACPGRFFAATELKTMMAYVVLNYDIKFADGGVRPDNAASALSTRPHQEAKVLFKKRKDCFI